jgi:hypothetical protein
VKGFVTKNVSGADQRDSTPVDAGSRLSKITKPSKPGVFASYTQLPWEDALTALLEIDDSVKLAQLSREAEAAQAWAAAQAALPSYQGLLNTESSEVQWPTNVHIDYSNAISRLNSVVAQAAMINDAAKKAGDLDQKYASGYSTLNKKLGQDVGFANQLYSKVVGVANMGGIFNAGLPKNLPPHLPTVTLK